jgi:tetratricopeptide (TPR) repeat protein
LSRKILSSILFLSLAPAIFASEIANLLRQGDAALARFDLPTALEAYRQAHRAAPIHCEAAWKLARACVDSGTLAKSRDEQHKWFIEAEQIARDAVKNCPDNAKAHAYLAIAVGKLALFSGGKRKVELSKEVKSEAERALSLDPNEDLAYHVLGVWHREMVQLNWALKQFAQLLYGRFPRASMDESLANLKKAVELAPNVVAHRYELGMTHRATGKWNEAVAEFRKAVELPKAWVTDDYYKPLAQQAIEKLQR